MANALFQLKSGLREAEADLRNELLRDGVIQRFEYSHELALRLIRQALETVFGDHVDTMAYNDVLRTAFERGLISDVERWFGYRSARNKTSHTYDATVAAEVIRSVRPFRAMLKSFSPVSMPSQILLRPEQLQLVRSILATHVPGYDGRVFGSRVTTSAKPASDLDLCIMDEAPVSPTILRHLQDAFSESTLPFKVDVACRSQLSRRFRDLIDASSVSLDKATAATGVG